MKDNLLEKSTLPGRIKAMTHLGLYHSATTAAALLYNYLMCQLAHHINHSFVQDASKR